MRRKPVPVRLTCSLETKFIRYSGTARAGLLSKCLAILIAFIVFGGIAVAVGQTESVLYTFTGGNDGENPLYGLIADASGSLYGTTYNGGNTPCGGGCGTVFQLTPSGNSWTETVLYRFAGAVNDDGEYPNSDLLMDANGALYGTTYEGGKSSWGDVFKLTPPLKKGGAWTETILHDFTGLPLDGGGPYGALVMDKHGALYGTTRYEGENGGGMVYKLTPHGNSWTEKVLYNFTSQGTNDGTSPLAGLIFDKKGRLYGTTSGGGSDGLGTVFKLTPPLTRGGAWTEAVLHSFTGAPDGALPQAGLTFDSAGAIYGTTSFGGKGTCIVVGTPGCGTVFRLTPPPTKGGAWKEKVLHAFDKDKDGVSPLDTPILDSTGALYGTTSGTNSAGLFGTVFKLTPPITKGKPWMEKTLYSFTGLTDGRLPGFGTLLRINGALYGTTIQGGPVNNPVLGVVFKIVP